jgi:diguanylate cyclase (GGDEF)-like protein
MLSSLFRTEDVVARIGGDEFVVLLPETDGAVLEQALSRIDEMLCLSGGEGQETCISLSIGGATALEPGAILTACHQADERMYRVKEMRKVKKRIG